MKKSKKKHKLRKNNPLILFISIYVLLALGVTLVLNSQFSAQRFTTQSKAAGCDQAGQSCCSEGEVNYCEGGLQCRNNFCEEPIVSGNVCNQPGQSCCSEGDVDYCNGGLSCQGNVCVSTGPYQEQKCADAGGNCIDTNNTGCSGQLLSNHCPTQGNNVMCCTAGGGYQSPYGSPYGYPSPGGNYTTPSGENCTALPKQNDLQFNNVSPANTSEINWPTVPEAARYQIRLDDPANGWSEDCGNPNPGDICDNNVLPTHGNTKYVFSPGFQARSGPYHFWYHAVNTCGAVSEAGHGYITVTGGNDTIHVPRDIYAIAKRGSSGKTEIHQLTASSGFQQFSLHAVSGLGPTDQGNWSFARGFFDEDLLPDIIAVNRNGSSGKTEVSVLSRSSDFSQVIHHQVTDLHTTVGENWVFLGGNFDGDDKTDLYAINKQGGSGKTDVHVLSGASNYKNFILHASSALHSTDNNWSFYAVGSKGGGSVQTARDYLYAIVRRGSSEKSELHILSPSSNFNEFTFHGVLPIDATTDPKWIFTGGAYDNEDFFTDLYVVNKKGNSGKTEVGVITDADAFNKVSVQTTTALHTTDGSVWTFANAQDLPVQNNPTTAPTNPAPSIGPSLVPTTIPTVIPSSVPSQTPSSFPTVRPSSAPTINPTSALSIAPTSRPTITSSVIPTVAPCVTRPVGDANCDGKTDLIDFEIWRKELTGASNAKTSDFNSDGIVDSLDFAIWRSSYQGL